MRGACAGYARARHSRPTRWSGRCRGCARKTKLSATAWATGSALASNRFDVGKRTEPRDRGDGGAGSSACARRPRTAHTHKRRVSAIQQKRAALPTSTARRECSSGGSGLPARAEAGEHQLRAGKRTREHDDGQGAREGAGGRGRARSVQRSSSHSTVCEQADQTVSTMPATVNARGRQTHGALDAHEREPDARLPLLRLVEDQVCERGVRDA